MSDAILKLPTRAAPTLQSQLSPQSGNEKPLSIERSHNDVLLRDIVQRHGIAGTTRPIQPTPILMQADRGESTAQRVESILEGVPISGFSVGGERRLCVPQMLNTVLKEATLEECNRALKQLNIHFSQCSKQQLGVLKVVGVLPLSADGCTLITKTDAERLCSVLLYGGGAASRQKRSRLVLKTTDHLKGVVPVEHDCFGGARGHFCPQLYDSPLAECIQCLDCREVFACDRFVLHTHRRGGESQTCHWGFDRANWRAYLRLARDCESKSEAIRALAEVKLRYDPVAYNCATDGLILSRILKRTADQANLTGGNGGVGDEKRICVSTYGTDLAPSAQQSSATSALINAYYQIYSQQQQARAALQQQQLLQQQLMAAAAAASKQQQPSLLVPSVSAGGASTTSAKTAEAAAGLLALSTAAAMEDGSALKSDRVPVTSIKLPIAIRPTVVGGGVGEPLKKHLLHQFEAEEKRRLSESAAALTTPTADEEQPPPPTLPTDEDDDDVSSPYINVVESCRNTPTVVNGQRRPDSGSTTTASENDASEYSSLDSLLSRYVQSESGLQEIREKIADSQRSLEIKIDSLQSDNQRLRQELNVVLSTSAAVKVSTAAPVKSY